MPHRLPVYFPLALFRGFVGRCPCCGKGALFPQYLKPMAQCAACGESLAHIRADDAPAWLTILLVGHVMAPILLGVVPYSTWPDWVSVLVWTGLALVLSLVILPRSKGFFIAFIWHSRAKRVLS